MAKSSADYVEAIEGGIAPTQAVQTNIYKRRWLVLAIFVLYSASNAMQWTQYTIISTIVETYYGVSLDLVNMTSMIYMITYIPFIVPASYFLDRFGLRYAAIFGAAGTALGSWIKVFSVMPDRFWLSFLGQTIVAVSQTFILSVPARLAAVWFGADQVSSACSIGVFGNQLGIAIGFVSPPWFVPDSKDMNIVANGLQIMFYVVAAFTSLILVLILLFFKDRPPLPPSPAQAVQMEKEKKDSFLISVKKLCTNRGYLMLLFSYAVNVGVFYAISTLLNTLVTSHGGTTVDSGGIGLSIVCAGMLGSVMCGVILDRTHKFKETTLSVYLFSFLGMVIYTTTLDQNKIWLQYLTSSLLGFFMTGYLPVGFEFAAELTYPEPEGTSAGLLNGMVQVFGIAFTVLYDKLIKHFGDLASNITLCIILFLGAIITYIIPNDLRRQNAKA